MKKYFVLFLALNLFISCSENPTQYSIVNGDINIEIWNVLNTNIILKKIDYEYYNNRQLKRKTISYPGNVNKTVFEYFYNDALMTSHETEICENIYADTIYFLYNSNNLLIQKQTAHSTQNFILRDTVFYNYSSSGMLIEWYKKDPYYQYSTTRRETYEYSNDLLFRKKSFLNEDLIRTYEYKYSNNLMAEELIYFGNNSLIEHRSKYYYHGDLLINVKGYFANETEWSDQIIYKYSDNKKLIKMTVYEPPFSSFSNHEIHYQY